MKKIILYGIGGIIVLIALIQLVPYGRNHTNPPVVLEPQWDSAATRELVVRACYDCHSNETVWPWYANIAPVSWLVQHDTDEGRQILNFSEMNRTYKELDEVTEVVAEGEMPPLVYLPTHPEARLTEAEKKQLVAGFQATFR